MKTKSRSEFELFSENQNKEYAMHYMEHHPATNSLVYVTIGDRAWLLNNKVYSSSTGRVAHSQLAIVRNDKLGFIFQSYNLINRTTVLKNVEFPGIVGGLSDANRRKL